MTQAVEPTSIVHFRSRVRTLLERERDGHRRPLVILAMDGVPLNLAQDAWLQARLEPMRSVFPTTSPTAWLSSLTGLGVDAHGVPGVVFRTANSGELPIHVFTHKGPLGPTVPTLFDDAQACGYQPYAITGDLNDLDCSWRALLLSGAQQVPSPAVYAVSHQRQAAPDPVHTCNQLTRAIRACLHAVPTQTPALVWCFLDLDLHVHRHGYDDHALSLLAQVERMAVDLAQDAVVVAHSDHGLVPTTHDASLAALFDGLTASGQCHLGGAGRVRWLYPRPGAEQQVRDLLARNLPASVAVRQAADFFQVGSLAYQRVGQIVLVAQGDVFVAPTGYRYEHGSLCPGEVDVPLAQWSW